MTLQDKEKELYEGMTLYVGIDVHKKDWKVSVVSENVILKGFTYPPHPKDLAFFLRAQYPGAHFKSCYEAGFCGFWIHHELVKYGIENIVVNAADVPTSNKERDQKRDKIDAKKLGKCLRGGLLKGIYTPQAKHLEDRILLRNRKRLVKDMTRLKNRIKGDLMFLGIKIPKEFDKTTWSKNFINWLCGVKFTNRSARNSLDHSINLLLSLEDQLKSLRADIVALSNTDYYQTNVNILQSVRGIGLISSMVILTEIGPIERFSSQEALRSYVGLIPTCHSSADKEGNGNMTKRGNRFIRNTLIECSWMAISKDPTLLQYYEGLCKRMKPNKAIIRVAKRLLNKIRAMLVKQRVYQVGL